MIKLVALKFANRLSKQAKLDDKLQEAKIYSKFQASNGWYERFKSRYHISLRAVTSKPFKLKSKKDLKEI